MDKSPSAPRRITPQLSPIEDRVVWISPKEWDPTLRRNAKCEVVSCSIKALRSQ